MDLLNCPTVLLLGFLVLCVNEADSHSNMVFSNAVEGEKLIKATTAFAIDLFKQLSAAKTGDNVFLSPACISVALAMTYLGARGNTAEQMKEVLQFTEVDPDHLHSSFSDLRQAMKSEENFTLYMANKLYPQQGYSFLPEFLEAAGKHYGADLQNVDFVKDAEGARQVINKWVESQTNKKITDLIPSGALLPLTRLVLVNAIYFKGDWDLKFDPAKTKKDDFILPDGSKVKVPLMLMTKKFNYGFCQELNTKAMELPYKGLKLSLIALLPEFPDGIAALERDLKPHHLANMQEHFHFKKRLVTVYLPKFRLEDSFDLGGTLQQMGIKDLFDSDADLSGIDGSRNLFVSKVVHKAFLEVNEEGSEAAAATGMVMMSKSRPKTFTFRADHPFLFFIRENHTDAILFVGKYSRPPGLAAGSHCIS